MADAESVAHLASPLALASRVTPNFRVRAHQKVISDAIVDAVTGRGPRFIAVSVPQQFGKSFMTSITTPAWWMELHTYGLVPGGLVGLVSNEDSLAMSWSIKTRRLIASRPDVFAMRLRADSKAAGSWETEEGGGILAVGIGGSIVGRPISLLVIDDPTKNTEQANSVKHREQVWDLWQTVGIGRLQPWTVVLVVMTRWSDEDLVGRLLSPEYEGDPAEWRYIRIPAVAEEHDPIGRAVGEALLRPQADQTQREAQLEMEKVRSRTSTYTWNTMWQQHPVDPEGTIFLESKWRYWGGDSEVKLPVDFEQVIMSWDMTFKDTQGSDWVVGQCWGGIGADRYLIDQVRGRWSFTDTCSQVIAFASRMRMKYPKAQAILVEDKANGPAVISQLRSKVGGLIEFPVNEYGSKTSRAWAVQPMLLGGNLYAPAPSVFSWVRDYIRELADFDRGKHDDQVDATTQALLWMTQYKNEPVTVYAGVGQSAQISPITRSKLPGGDPGLWLPTRSGRIIPR